MEAIPEPAVPPPDASLDLMLGELPKKWRLPLVLFYSERMSYAEIAQALRLPISTVRSRLCYAKERLRKELAE